MQELDTQITVTKNDETYSPAIAGMVAASEAWLKAACAMAVRFPRDMDKVRERLLHECDRPSFAAAALYAKPVGGKSVTGLSIRFAEAAIAAMGHLHITTNTLAETDDWRKIEVKVWDSQSMISYADEATVQKTIERKSIAKGQEVIRTRANRQGELLYIIRAEEGDLLNTVNAAKSKSIRNSGLRCVPGWLLDECKLAVNETMRKKDSADPDKAKREIFDAFAGLGVSVDLLKSYLGHENATLQPAELQELRKLFTAIRDGETTIQAVIAQRNEKDKPGGEATGNGAKGTAGLKSRLSSSETIKKEQAATLDSEATKAGFKPLEWANALSKAFGTSVSERIPADKYDAALKLATGAQ